MNCSHPYRCHRLAADKEKKELKEQNKNLRNQLRDLNGGMEEDYENINDNLSTWSPADLVNLDRSCSSMTREGLQQLIKQVREDSGIGLCVAEVVPPV